MVLWDNDGPQGCGEVMQGSAGTQQCEVALAEVMQGTDGAQRCKAALAEVMWGSGGVQGSSVVNSACLSVQRVKGLNFFQAVCVT